jgi:hypothetical protein
MLIRVRPTHTAAEIMRVVKTNSSRWARQKYSPEFAWQTGYGVFSVSDSNAAAVTKYIARQQEHHKEQSFQEEFVEFLKRNHIEYDPKYISESKASSRDRRKFPLLPKPARNGAPGVPGFISMEATGNKKGGLVATFVFTLYIYYLKLGGVDVTRNPGKFFFWKQQVRENWGVLGA